jgi:hypothetical protein
MKVYPKHSTFDVEHATTTLSEMQANYFLDQLRREQRSNNWENWRSKLAEILLDLPIVEDQKRHVPDAVEYLIEWYERAGKPRAIDGGQAAAKQELETLNKLAFDLGKHIASMHRDTLRTIGGFDKSPDAIAHALLNHPKSLIDAAVIGLKCLPTHSEEEVDETSMRLERAYKKREMQMTDKAFEIYTELTGKEVGRQNHARGVGHRTRTIESGPALDYLTQIFNAFEIKASPSGQLKSFMARQARRPKPPPHRNGKKSTKVAK